MKENSTTVFHIRFPNLTFFKIVVSFFIKYMENYEDLFDFMKQNWLILG